MKAAHSMTSTHAPAEAPLSERSFDDLLAQAVAFHGHLCPGQVLGVRITQAGCRQLGFEYPRNAGKRLVVFVEIDRCATDAIQALTGVSVGKRTLKHLDYGKMAATFVDVVTGDAVRISARDSSRLAALEWAAERDPLRAQVVAYRTMPDDLLLKIERVLVEPGWLDRRRVRVPCAACGEGINYQREVVTGGRTLCRPCSGDGYYRIANGPASARASTAATRMASVSSIRSAFTSSRSRCTPDR